MKIIYSLLFSITIIGSYSSLQASSDLLGVALVGALTGTSISAGNSAYYDRVLESELDSWRDSNTNSSTRLYNKCGMNYELKVIGNRRHNSITVVIHNSTDGNVIVKPEEVAIEFSNGTRKYPDFHRMPSDIEIKSHWRFKGIIPVHEKSLFKDIDSLSVIIPVYEANNKLRCTMTGVLKRESQIKPEEYSKSNYLDLILGLGAGLVESNDLYNSMPSTLNLEWNLYPWANKGFTIGFSIRNHGSSNARAVEQRINSGAVDPLLNDRSLYLGYVQRWNFKDTHAFMAQAGISFESTDIEYPGISFSSSSRSRELYNETGGYLQLSYDYMFASSPYGFWAGDYSVGLGYRHHYSKEKEFSGIDFGGHRGSVVLYLRMAL